MKWIGVALIACVLYFSLRTGRTERIVEDHPYIGRNFTAGEEVFYNEGCKQHYTESCGSTDRDREIDRILVCESHPSGGVQLYENKEKIDRGTTFEIVELLDIRPIGITSAFSSDIVLAVLEDSEGVLSTFLFGSSMDSDPHYFGNGNVCTRRILR